MCVVYASTMSYLHYSQGMSLNLYQHEKKKTYSDVDAWYGTSQAVILVLNTIKLSIYGQTNILTSFHWFKIAYM